MDTLKDYRNADYDTDMFFDKTTSWPDGLQEKDQFVPNFLRPVRRTNSTDDIQRYKDHFLLGQRNMGKWFKWNHYMELLRDDLRNFDTVGIMTKTLVERVTSPRESEMSHYVTASENEFMEKSKPRYTKKVKKFSLLDVEGQGDMDNITSTANINMKSAPSIETISTSVAGISINSKTPLLPQKSLQKTLVKCLASPQEPEMSHYRTASESKFIEKSQPKYTENVKQQSFFAVEYQGDTDSMASTADINRNSVPSKETISTSSVAGISINSNTPLLPQKNLLKKICGEMRQLATKTYKTVEQMSVKSKYCSLCGDNIANRKKVHEDCPQLLRNVVDRKKPFTTDIIIKNIEIRKLSSEIRQLASETSRTVEKMFIKSTYCSICGDFIV